MGRNMGRFIGIFMGRNMGRFIGINIGRFMTMRARSSARGYYASAKLTIRLLWLLVIVGNSIKNQILGKCVRKQLKCFLYRDYDLLKKHNT